MRVKNFVKVGTTLLFATGMLAACGNSKSSSSTDKDSDSASTKKTVTWTTMLHTPTAPSGDVQSKLEKYTGMKIKFSWVPDASKDEKINAALASKSLTDVTSLTDISNATVRKAMKSGMFWDVEKYLKDYPNLAKISKKTIDASKIDGHLYGVPYVKPMARYGILIRQDWLDKLGLKAPKTVNDLTKIAQAFTEDDPDGDGKKDTVGFVERNESFNVGFRSMTGYFGAGNQFAVVKGKVIPSFMQPGYKDALKFYRNIYKNGWMNSDFSVMAKQDQKNYIAQGKGGIVVSGLMEASNYVAAAKGTNQEGKMKWLLVNDLKGTNGKRTTLSDTNGGMGGWLAISKQSVKSVKDLKAVLKFIDKLSDKKPYVWMTEGIKGQHYSLNDKGEYTITNETKWEQEVQPFAGSRPSETVANLKFTDPLENEQQEKITENGKYAVINPAQSLSSDTYDAQWSTLIEPISDAYYKYMMGQNTMKDWDAAVKNFRTSGGDQVIKEFTASYKKANE